MKGFLQQLPEIKDPENYSDLLIMHGSSGYYLGTMYRDKDLWNCRIPGTRDTQYFETKEEAESLLKALEAGEIDPATVLRKNKNWKVYKFGGNRNHIKRCVFEGTEFQARNKFVDLYQKMRQGSVELYDFDDKLIDRYMAYRNRTRW